MSETLIVALISFCGTLLGTFGGIVTSQKLVNYRIQQLEKKVDKHNNFAERMPVMAEQIKGIEHRQDEIEKILLK